MAPNDGVRPLSPESLSPRARSPRPSLASAQATPHKSSGSHYFTINSSQPFIVQACLNRKYSVWRLLTQHITRGSPPPRENLGHNYSSVNRPQLPRSSIIAPPVNPSHPQKCEACGVSDNDRVKGVKIWHCVNCGGSAICEDCWDKQIAHRPGKKGDDGLPHEKANLEVLSRFREILDPSTTLQEQENLHRRDEECAWFGVTRDENDHHVFLDYGRFATVMAEGRPLETGHRYPQLVSFIGPTGAGKSTLVKMLIDQQESASNLTGVKQFPSPVVGRVANEHTPTSGDVHLYVDPSSYLGSLPILYADCEGLEGGERTPVGSIAGPVDRKERAERSRLRSRSDSYSEHTLRKSMQNAGKFTGKTGRGSKRRLRWATDAETRRRGYAVAELYPRLLYTFSDVVVFCLRNARSFEATLLLKIVEWAHASLEKSINQPTLPHAVIALNATDTRVAEGEWNTDYATRTLMTSVANAVDQYPKLQELVAYWHERGRRIHTMEDLILCYYSSIRVVRIPVKGRYMLLSNQIDKLYKEMEMCCTKSYHAKRKARMLSTVDEMGIYLQAAFDHFSENLDRPFNFIEVALKNNPIPLDFGGNILQLVKSMHAVNQFRDPMWLFKSLSGMVASCIQLDCSRRRLRGTINHLLEQEYMDFCDYALSEFCDQFLPCSFQNHKGRCMNQRLTHSQKGHQDHRGRIIGSGLYQSSFNYDDYIAEWEDLMQKNISHIEKVIQEKLSADRKLDENDAVSAYHLEQVNMFYRSVGGYPKYKSHSVCLCCLREVPKHPLPCGHVLCYECVCMRSQRERNSISLQRCPLHLSSEPFNRPWSIVRKPDLAGVRLLSLDGGGVRGIVELEVLRTIELVFRDQIPIRAFFDLIVGTSTGGIIALGLGIEQWSIEECINRFTRMCNKGFTQHRAGKLALLNHGAKYKTKPLEQVLRDSFSDDPIFGGAREHQNTYLNKVAVSSTTESWDEAVVFSNYNRNAEELYSYKFARMGHPNYELKVWEAARATSAAPTYFKALANHRTGQRFVDGGIYYNNPVEIAMGERKLIWPDIAHLPPDLLLSIGTGRESIRLEHDEFDERPITKLKRAFANQAQAPDPKERIRRIGGGWIPGFVKNVRSRIDNSMNTEETWLRFKRDVLDFYPLDQERYQRINLNFGERKVPSLDAKDEVMPLKEITKSKMRPTIDYPSSQIMLVAHRLVASCFYLELLSPTGPHEIDGIHQFSGRMCCRFPDGSNELRGLGNYLKSLQSARFQPFFSYEAEEDIQLKDYSIHPSMIQTMKDRATFERFRITLKVLNPLRPTRILVPLTSRSDCHPISGFPRNLVEDTKTKYHRSASSERLPGSRTSHARRRQSARHIQAKDFNIPRSIEYSPQHIGSPTMTPHVAELAGDTVPDSYATELPAGDPRAYPSNQVRLASVGEEDEEQSARTADTNRLYTMPPRRSTEEDPEYRAAIEASLRER